MLMSPSDQNQQKLLFRNREQVWCAMHAGVQALPYMHCASGVRYLKRFRRTIYYSYEARKRCIILLA